MNYNNFQRKSKKETNEGGRPGTWQLHKIEKESARFQKYYKAQGIVPEGQWDDFMAALRRELPIAFRFVETLG